MVTAPVRLPFGNEQAIAQQTESDFLAHLQKISRPVTDAKFTTRRSHFSRATSIRIGGLVIATCQSSPVHLETAPEPQQTILMLLQGSGKVVDGTTEHQIPSENAILRSSYHNSLRLDYGQMVGVTIRPDIDALTADIESRLPGKAGIRDSLFSSGTNVFRGEAKGVAYRGILLKLLEIVDNCACDAAFLKRIGFEGLVTKCIGELITAEMGFDCYGGKELSMRLSVKSAVDVICDHIQANIGTPLTVSRMSRLSGSTMNDLNNAFQSRFNCSALDWQRNFLLDEARKLLAPSVEELPIEEVARQLGFSSARSLVSHYTKRFGEKPSAIRSRDKNQKPH